MKLCGVSSWTQDQLNAWLRSASSPLGVTDTPQIRTVGEANRVWWALKAMLRRSGRWQSFTNRKVQSVSITRSDTEARA